MRPHIPGQRLNTEVMCRFNTEVMCRFYVPPLRAASKCRCHSAEVRAPQSRSAVNSLRSYVTQLTPFRSRSPEVKFVAQSQFRSWRLPVGKTEKPE